MPVIGWMWYFLEIVFCKRKWEEDRRLVAQSLQNLRDYPENYWVGFSPPFVVFFFINKSDMYKKFLIYFFKLVSAVL